MKRVLTSKNPFLLKTGFYCNIYNKSGKYERVKDNQNLLGRNQERIKEPKRDGIGKRKKRMEVLGSDWKREAYEIIRRREEILKTNLEKTI